MHRNLHVEHNLHIHVFQYTVAICLKLCKSQLHYANSTVVHCRSIQIVKHRGHSRCCIQFAATINSATARCCNNGFIYRVQLCAQCSTQIISVRRVGHTVLSRACSNTMQYAHCEFPLVYTDTVHISGLVWRPIHLPRHRWAPSTCVRCWIYWEQFTCQNTNKLSVLQRIAPLRAQGRVAVSCSGWQNNAIADRKLISYHMLGHPTHICWPSIEWVNAMHVRLARITPGLQHAETHASAAAALGLLQRIARIQCI